MNNLALAISSGLIYESERICTHENIKRQIANKLSNTNPQEFKDAIKHEKTITDGSHMTHIFSHPQFGNRKIVVSKDKLATGGWDIKVEDR